MPANTISISFIHLTQPLGPSDLSRSACRNDGYLDMSILLTSKTPSTPDDRDSGLIKPASRMKHEALGLLSLLGLWPGMTVDRSVRAPEALGCVAQMLQLF